MKRDQAGRHKLYPRSGAYRSWDSAVQRCTNPNAVGYAEYGGSGITICDRWRESFANFLADMGERPEGMSLDRYPNNAGNYEPGNCRWATPLQQTLNRRGDWGRVLELNGKRQSLTEWAQQIGISVPGLIVRLKRWASVEKALTTPVPERYRR